MVHEDRNKGYGLDMTADYIPLAISNIEVGTEEKTEPSEPQNENCGLD